MFVNNYLMINIKKLSLIICFVDASKYVERTNKLTSKYKNGNIWIIKSFSYVVHVAKYGGKGEL